MRCLKTIFIVFCIIVSSCSDVEDQWISSAFSCGVLSTAATSYSPNELTLIMTFFVLDKEESGQLTTKNFFDDYTLYSSRFTGVLENYTVVNTPFSGNYSCAVLLDDIYNRINYDYHEEYSATEYFVRKFFKNAGINNSFIFSAFNNQNDPLTIYGNGYTDEADIYDMVLAEVLNDSEELSEKVDSLPLLTCLDSLMEFIHYKSTPGIRDNLLLLYSNNVYSKMKFKADDIISKALDYNIRVSTILDFGGEYYLTQSGYTEAEEKDEDLFYKMSVETGGIYYKNNDALSGEDLLVLASRLGNIMEGSFQCFESTWTLYPKYSDTLFRTGYLGKGELEIKLQTSYDIETFDLPFGFIIAE